MSQGSNSTETITLLFTDLVGSTELMAGLEADVADTVRRDHFARLQACVDRAGGRLVKNLGDGVMAVFGSSSAAIECAVGMQQDVERAARRHGVALRIRIGVAAGDVLVEDGDCFGSPVVEGARLCDLAKGGQILATEIVGRMASGRSKARLAALGEMELKGLPEPVPVVEVGWSASRATAGLLERAEELERLTDAFEAAAAGSGRVVLAEGPPGIGKTTLLRACDADAVVTLRARGAQLEQDYAWGVVRQLFEDWLHGQPAAERERLLSGAAEPARAALGDAAVGDLQPFAAVHGLYWLAVNVAERTPLVLVVDDAHWCDDASLRWLAYLSARVDGAPLSVVLGVRRPDPGADRQPLLQIEAEPSTTLIRPAPLSETATRELVTSRLARDGVSEIAAACHEATGGNPFLLRALLDDLAQLPEGRAPDPGTVRALRPAAISRAVLLRIGGLQREAHPVARAIAVLGGSATAARVAALTGHGAEATSDALSALGRRRDPRRPAAAGLRPPARARGDPGRSPGVRAQRLAPACGRAAARLRRSHRRGGSAAHADRARRRRRGSGHAAALSGGGAGRGGPRGRDRAARAGLAEPPARGDVAALERLRGRALLRARGAEGLDALRAAVAAATDPGERAGAALELARALEGLSRNTEATEVYESVLRDAGEAHVRDLRAGLVVAATQHLSTLPRGLEALGAMLQEPERDDAAATIVKAAVALATTAAGGPDGPAQAEEALARGHLLDAEPSIAIGMAITALVWGDRLEAALAAWDEVVERASSRSEPLRLAFALTFRGGVHLRAGRLADAEADERAALDVPQEMWTASAVPVDIHALLGRDAAGAIRPRRRRRGARRARAGRAAVRLPGQQHRPHGARPDPLRARADRGRPRGPARARAPLRRLDAAQPGGVPVALPRRRRSAGDRPRSRARSWPTRRSSWRAPSAPPARWAWRCAARDWSTAATGASSCWRRPSRLSPPPPRASSTPARWWTWAPPSVAAGQRQAARERLAEGLDLAAACGAGAARGIRASGAAPWPARARAETASPAATRSPRASCAWRVSPSRASRTARSPRSSGSRRRPSRPTSAAPTASSASRRARSSSRPRLANDRGDVPDASLPTAG